MTDMPYHYGASERRDPGFFRRMWAVVIKEFVQMRRDRMTFATMIIVPIMQLVLFGYAINTDPKQLPSSTGWCAGAKCSSRSKFQQASSAMCAGATARKSW